MSAAVPSESIQDWKSFTHLLGFGDEGYSPLNVWCTLNIRVLAFLPPFRSEMVIFFPYFLDRICLLKTKEGFAPIP
jgi:hypothetical protein